MNRVIRSESKEKQVVFGLGVVMRRSIPWRSVKMASNGMD